MKKVQMMMALISGLLICISLAGCAAPASPSDSAVTTEPCAYAVYEAQQGELSDAEFAEKLSRAAEVLRQRFVEAGYADTVVTVEGETQIRAQIPLREFTSENDLEAVFRSACERSVFEICDIYSRTMITGDQVEQAEVCTIKNDVGEDENVVYVTFNEEAAQTFADITKKSSETQRTLDIKLNGAVISSPVAVSEITGGEAYISGGDDGMTADEAQDLASQIASAALPLALTTIEFGTTGNL